MRRDGKRFFDSVEIDGPISVIVVEALRTVSQNTRH